MTTESFRSSGISRPSRARPPERMEGASGTTPAAAATTSAGLDPSGAESMAQAMASWRESVHEKDAMRSAYGLTSSGLAASAPVARQSR